jgi:integrase
MSLVRTDLDPATQAKYASIARTYGVTESTTWPDIIERVRGIENPNTRRSVIIALRSMIGSEGAPRIPAAQRRMYAELSEAELAERSGGEHQVRVLLMACAGLRAGEAVAVRPEDAQTNGTLHWIEVRRSRQNTGRIKEPKSGPGRVVIPEWLYTMVRESEPTDLLPNSLYKWCRRRGIAPHGMRHQYATHLVRTTANVELARRQLRHSSIKTTLSVYVEVTAQDQLAVIGGMANPLMYGC